MNKFAPRGIISANGHYHDRVLRPVIGVDIDGTLGEWHAMFLRFAEMYLQKSFSGRFDGTTSLAQFMGVSKTTYRRVKLAFRQSGLKRAMQPLPGAVNMVRGVRSQGAEVWVCTTRPYLRLDNIDPDTRWWLYHHGIRIDGVLFGEKKWRDLHDLVGRRVLGVLDDLPEQVESATAVGLPATLINRRHNEHALALPRVHTLYDAESIYREAITAFRLEHNVGGE